MTIVNRTSDDVVKMIAESTEGHSIKGRGPQGLTLIEKGPLRIVITDSPSDFNMDTYVKDLVRLNVKHVARACEATYSPDKLTDSNILFHDLHFSDGDAPPENVLAYWLKLVETCFLEKSSKKKKETKKDLVNQTKLPPSVRYLENGERISVHCVAGLGRAPLLVAVALVEFCNMEAYEAVKYIRKQRRGAINKKQLEWLEHYQPKHRTVTCFSGCVIA